MEWLSENLNWIIPLLFTVIFSVVNTIMANTNRRVAASQIKLQTGAFCFQLFHSRMEIYRHIKSTLSSAIHEGNVSVSQIFECKRTTADAGFLFGSEITETIDKIWDAMVQLETAVSNIEHFRSMNDQAIDYTQLQHEKLQALNKLTGMEKKLKDQFAPYISFEAYRMDTAEVRV